MRKKGEPWHEYARRKNDRGLHWTVEGGNIVQVASVRKGAVYIVVWDGLMQLGGFSWRWWLGIDPPFEVSIPGFFGRLFGETATSRSNAAIRKAQDYIATIKKVRAFRLIRRGARKAKWTDQ